MPSEPVQKGETHRVVVEIQGPLSKDKLAQFHKALKALARTVRGKVVEKRRRKASY
jgi:hypothetical protein